MKAGQREVLPSYQLRVSSRTRHVKLKVLPYEGLVVVVPKGFNRARVEALVRQRQQWIHNAFAELHRDGVCTEPLQVTDLPASLQLPATGYHRQLDYIRQDKNRVQIREHSQSLELSGPVHLPELSQQALLLWLRHRARLELEPWLDRLSEATGLKYNRLTIRGQKSRWGSCSSEGNISLNFKLLFLPPDKVSYILLHELCHLRHMNHSPRFWTFMESLLPGARVIDRQCQHAWQYVPHWVEARFIQLNSAD